MRGAGERLLMRLRRPAWALPPAVRWGGGLVPQRPQVAAHGMAADWLPILSYLPATFKNRITQFVEHSGRGGLERQVPDFPIACIRMFEELLGV